MKEKGSNASEDDRHGGYYGKKQDQDSGAQYPDAPRRGEGQGQCGAGEDGQRRCHRGHAVSGAAAFLGDFFAAFGIVTTIGPTPSGIAGGNRSTPSSIKA